jgi:RHS repeat-associated protein
MGVYKRSFATKTGNTEVTDALELEESQIYGSSRLGIDLRKGEGILSSVTYSLFGTQNGEYQKGQVVVSSSLPGAVIRQWNRKLGYKNYELSNHLGNVLVTISDRKLPVQGNPLTFVGKYLADVVATNDYSAFGAPMVGRGFNSPSYRYGFNGKENDAESVDAGEGLQDYGMRIYNPSIGKFLSVDPLAPEYPWNSTYAFAENDVIRCIDLDGAEKYYTIKGEYLGQIGSSTEIKIINGDDLKRYSYTYQLGVFYDAQLLRGKRGEYWRNYLNEQSIVMPNNFMNSLHNQDVLLPPSINAYQKSGTFKLLVDNTIPGITIKYEGVGTYTNDYNGNIQISSYTDVNNEYSFIMGMTWELTNSKNYQQLKKADESVLSMTKDEFVREMCRIEADATFNQEMVLRDLGVADKYGNPAFKEKFDLFANNKITKDDLLKFIADWNYNNGHAMDNSGNSPTFKKVYGEKYDALKKQKSKRQ